MTPKLNRSTLRTSRLLDFFSQKELVAQTGHATGDWPLVLVKELLDNALDACEDTGTAPKIIVAVDKDGITVTDNGPGLPADTVAGVLDFTVRVSSREHHVSPTRGAQGNALKTVIAMPFVLHGRVGRVDIAARGVRHEIHVRVDTFKQLPVIDALQREDRRFVKNGTSVKVYWPDSASSIRDSAKGRFLQIADDFTFLNPHLSLAVDWYGERRSTRATARTWPKWLPSHPTCIHWYTLERFGRLIAGYISLDESQGRDRTIREFVSEFAGLAGSAKQRDVLEAAGLARLPLSALRKGNDLDDDKVRALLKAMRAHSRPVKPTALGTIGRDHIATRFRDLGCEMETFVYRREIGKELTRPSIIETAFAAKWSAFQRSANDEGRRIITGVNWSPSIAANPFRQLGQESLDSVLQEQRAGRDEEVVFLLHLACPNVKYTDRGKSAVVFDDEYEDGDL